MQIADFVTFPTASGHLSTTLIINMPSLYYICQKIHRNHDQITPGRRRPEPALRGAVRTGRHHRRL